MISGQPSTTAMLVASSLVRQGAAHGLPSLALHLAECALSLGAAHASPIGLLTRHWPGRWLLAAIERAVLPGLAAHHCKRKAWLWQRLQDRPWSDQTFVWLGVGFDGLGRALLAGDGGVRIIETDHPDTLAQRRALLGDQDVEMHAIQLPQQLDALLSLCARQPVTIICEGVLMYVQRRAALHALRALAALPTAPRLIFSALDTRQPGGPGFRRPAAAADRWLDRHGEPFRWRAPPRRVEQCLAAVGYVVAAWWDGDGFGEYIIEAVPASHACRQTGR